MAPPKTTWTDELTAKLTRLAEPQDLSASQLATEIGHGVTRNAIIGKIHRMGLKLSGGGRPASDKPKTKQPRLERMARTKPPAITASSAIIERPAGPFLNIPLVELELGDGRCRYPVGDGPFFFCGQPSMEGSPYCPRCHRICYRPANPPNPQYFPQFKRKAA